MNTSAPAPTWFDARATDAGNGPNERRFEFIRLWQGFMTARATLAGVLVLLHASLYFLAAPQNGTPLLICSAYLAVALTARILATPEPLGRSFNVQWARSVGVDLLIFTALQTFQNTSVNYAPLFAFPVLMAAVLGSQRIANASAASVTLLLLGHAGWMSLQAPWLTGERFLQAALTGAGCFAIAFIASQLATRLANMELKAQRSHLAATVQRQVNALIIDSLTEGVLVVDEQHQVRAANPAAQRQVSPPQPSLQMPLNLATAPGLRELRQLIDASFASQSPQTREIHIAHPGQVSRLVLARTELTAQLNPDAHGMCVVFMQDQRELQARLRAEKFASMGRMSAAVAHEIRNPLAAILQANALLAEDLTDPAQQQLTSMVQQNALRLEKTAHDILHVAELPHADPVSQSTVIDLAQTLPKICHDWQVQGLRKPELQLQAPAQPCLVWFDADHLHRILVNLLDNALRYASHRAESIQVSVDTVQDNPSMTSMRVWSDGQPLDPSVEQHLFEPFFSSESRSSGLGLYISRELCDSHGAVISYQRSTRPMQGQPVTGNEFCVAFKTHLPPRHADATKATKP